MTGSPRNEVRVLRADDEILVVAQGVCPPIHPRVHLCSERFSVFSFIRMFERAVLDPMALGTCVYCKEALP